MGVRYPCAYIQRRRLNKMTNGKQRKKKIKRKIRSISKRIISGISAARDVADSLKGVGTRLA